MPNETAPAPRPLSKAQTFFRRLGSSLLLWAVVLGGLFSGNRLVSDFVFLGIMVLLATAALSLVLVGFGNGRSGQRFPLLDGIYAGVLAIALWMIIDLDYPRQGLIQLSARPLADALAAMK